VWTHSLAGVKLLLGLFHYAMGAWCFHGDKGTHTHTCPVAWPSLPALVGLSFVMVNSVAMEGDGCIICSEEEAELREISRKLNCSQEVGDLCAHVSQRLHSQMPWLLVTRLLFPLLVVTTGIDGLTRWLLTSRCRDPVSVTVSPSRGSPCPLQCCCRWAGGGV
jgi:hypothetical protein